MEAEFLIGREISSKECGQIGSCKYKTKPGQPSELWDCLVEFVIQKSLHTHFFLLLCQPADINKISWFVI